MNPSVVLSITFLFVVITAFLENKRKI
jgi:hypothetical protein